MVSYLYKSGGNGNGKLDYKKKFKELYLPKNEPCIIEVPPLEGLWWLDDSDEFDYNSKSKFYWTSMIRQPEFVTDAVFAAACEHVIRKKGLDTKNARFVKFTEGLCVQCMHCGSFDDEPATLSDMKLFIAEQGLLPDLSDTRRHHEIYLSDPRKTEVSNMKTILRHPIRRKP